MKKTKAFTIIAASLLSLSSFACLAEMTLNKDLSSITFASTKNEHVSEQHTFDSYSGTLDDNGKLVITIDIRSLNTIIPIRNERMLKMLFNATDYATASFAADIAPELMKLEAGQLKHATVAGEMMIAGNTAPVSFDLVITGLQNGGVNASTTKPTIINTSTFNLDAGVAALQEVAMLKSISKTVPLSFSATFQ